MNCAECPKREGNVCLAYGEARSTLDRGVPPHPFSGCMIPIVDGYLSLIGPGHQVLEIGCGSWSRIKDHCDNVGAHYEAINVADEYFAKKTVATRIENVAALSFDDDVFDFVIGNQTMEHWGEYGCRTGWGISQCFRVAKPGGRVLMNVPIYFHGTRPFLMGKLSRIRDLYSPYSNDIEVVPWGQETSPIEGYKAHPGYPFLRNRVAFLVDIRATKDKKYETAHTNRFAASGLLARLLNNPPTYVIYQVLLRVGLLKP